VERRDINRCSVLNQEEITAETDTEGDHLLVDPVAQVDQAQDRKEEPTEEDHLLDPAQVLLVEVTHQEVQAEDPIIIKYKIE
jgi:hypothetical protein